MSLTSDVELARAEKHADVELSCTAKRLVGEQHVLEHRLHWRHRCHDHVMHHASNAVVDVALVEIIPNHQTYFVERVSIYATDISIRKKAITTINKQDRYIRRVSSTHSQQASNCHQNDE